MRNHIKIRVPCSYRYINVNIYIYICAIIIFCILFPSGLDRFYIDIYIKRVARRFTEGNKNIVKYYLKTFDYFWILSGAVGMYWFENDKTNNKIIIILNTDSYLLFSFNGFLLCLFFCKFRCSQEYKCRVHEKFKI